MRALLAVALIGFLAYLAPGLIFGITFALFKCINLGLHALIETVNIGRHLWAACGK